MSSTPRLNRNSDIQRWGKLPKPLINSTKSTMSGLNQIQAGFIKAVTHKVGPFLSQLINIIIPCRHYSTEIVKGRTVPVYKNRNEDKLSPDSYREVTTVSIIGKVIEKVIVAQIDEQI